MDPEDVTGLIEEMEQHERTGCYLESDGGWIELDFSSNGDYYSLYINPARGEVQLWSDEEEEKYTISE